MSWRLRGRLNLAGLVVVVGAWLLHPGAGIMATLIVLPVLAAANRTV